MSVTHDPQGDLDGLTEALAGMRTELERLGERRSTQVPEISAWSADQQLYHVALATHLALRNVRSLVARKGRLISQEGEPTELAVKVLLAGSYPRGESEAPRMVQAPQEVDPEFLEMEMRGNEDVLPSLRELLPEIPDAPGCIPHHVLGGLDAGDWLRFARMHAEHHLAIVRDLRERLS